TALVQTEGLEEHAVRMHRDNRVENPIHEFALAQPGIVGPDGFPQRPQRESQQWDVAGDPTVKAHRPPLIGRNTKQCPIAVGLEYAWAGIVEGEDHAAFLS